MDVALGCEEGRARCGRKRRNKGTIQSALGGAGGNGETYDSETLSARIASSSTDNPDNKGHNRPAKADNERRCGRQRTRETTNALESERESER